MEEAVLYILINGLDESATELNISRDKLEKFISRTDLWKFEFFKQMKEIIVSSVEAMGLKGTSEALSLPDAVVAKISGQGNGNQTATEINQLVESTYAGVVHSETQTKETKRTDNQSQTLNRENESFIQSNKNIQQNVDLIHELDNLIFKGFSKREIIKRTNIPKEIIINRFQQLQMQMAQYAYQSHQSVQLHPSSALLQDLPVLPTKRTINSDRSPVSRNYMSSPTQPSQPIPKTPPATTHTNSTSGHVYNNNSGSYKSGAFNSRNIRKNIIIATGDDIAPDYSYRP